MGVWKIASTSVKKNKKQVQVREIKYEGVKGETKKPELFRVFF